MRFKVLATDYDGTLAWHGVVEPGTIEALEAARASGRQLVLVTGREVGDLQTIFKRLDLFELVVAENGAVLFRPRDGQVKLLAEPPPKRFIDELRARGVEPLSVGHVIVATFEPHELTVIKLIRDLGLELQVIFNKGSVMVLPSGINKASGLKAGLREIGLSLDQAVGIGDAENDHALLEICACGVAVENALPTLKEHADFVTRHPNGRGVAELIGHLLENDLSNFSPRERTREPLAI
jgi:HAD superfamily hydrolase (TIGR01484 family)